MKESRLINFFKRCIAVSEYLAIAMTALDRGDPHLHRGGVRTEGGWGGVGVGVARTPSLLGTVLGR